MKTNEKTYNQYSDTNYKQLWINKNIKEIHKSFPSLESLEANIFIERPPYLEWNQFAIVEIVDTFEDVDVYKRQVLQ